MENIAIVIVNFNGEKDTIACLRSISQLSIVNCQLSVIIVDNSLKKQLTVKSLGEAGNSHFIDKITIIRNEENLGFAGGNNVGIKYALEHGAEYILILNNDTIVHKNLVTQLLSHAKSSEKIGIVVPKIYFAKGYEFHKDRYKKSERGRVIWYAGGIMDWSNVMGIHRGVDRVDNGQYEKTEETDFASGCCMLVKKEIFEKVGLFDERFFLYYEDSNFTKKVKNAGYSVIYIPKAILWHKNAGSTGGSGSSLQDYYITRNRLLFGMHYAPLRSKLALIREGFQILFRGRYWQKRGVLDFCFGRLGKGSYTG